MDVRLHIRNQPECSDLGADNRLSKAGCFGHHFISLSYPNDFFNRRFTLKNAAPAILTKREHALSNSALLQLAAVGLFHDEPLQRFSHETDFINREPALVAGLPTILTAGSALENRSSFNRKSNFFEIFRGIFDGRDAIGADRAHETLGEKRFHHRSEKERLNI